MVSTIEVLTYFDASGGHEAFHDHLFAQGYCKRLKWSEPFNSGVPGQFTNYDEPGWGE
jgi:hypothetical protein